MSANLLFLKSDVYEPKKYSILCTACIGLETTPSYTSVAFWILTHGTFEGLGRRLLNKMDISSDKNCFRFMFGSDIKKKCFIAKGPIVYFIEDRSPSRQKQRFSIYVTGALMEHFFKTSAPLRPAVVN